jgi:hypothetical protein
LIGPHLPDFYDEARESAAVEAARAMFSYMLEAADSADVGMTAKARLYLVGLAIFGLSLLICLPIVLIDP